MKKQRKGKDSYPGRILERNPRYPGKPRTEYQPKSEEGREIKEVNSDVMKTSLFLTGGN